MQKEELLSRRSFLQRVGAVGAAGLGAGVFLSACGGDAETEAPEVVEDSEGGLTPNQAGVDCTDVTGLTEEEIQVRETLQYVDNSPFPEKVCDNCHFWQPAEAGASCGGCQILKGPVAPGGYCTSWTAKMS